MADAVRKLILQNIRVELQKILVENGYHNDLEPNAVRRAAGTGLTASELPTLFIVAGTETAEEGPPGLTTWELGVTVEAHLRESNPEKLADAVEDIASDIRRAMHVDNGRGKRPDGSGAANAIDTVDVSAEPPAITDLEDNRTAIRLNFAVTYRTDRDNPESVLSC